MNKKSAILFFSVLFLLSLGVYYAMAVGLSALSITKAGDGYNVANWITNIGTQANLTIESTSNIANISITLPQDNITWVALAEGGIAAENISEGETLTNMTYHSDGTAWPQWNCVNASDNSNKIWCSVADALQGLGSAAGNMTMIVMLNITGSGTANEEYYINFTVDDNASAMSQSTTLNADYNNPVLVDLNVSDGSMTYYNGSLNGFYGLSTRSSWTVEATIWDSNLETLANTLLAYRCDNGDVGFLKADDNKTYVTPSGSGKLRGITGTISSTCFTAYNGDATNITFSLEVNDTFNKVTTLNESADKSFTVLGMYEVLPRIGTVNVTQTELTTISKTLSTTSELDGDDYLAANTATFNIEVAGNRTKNDLLIVWNDTGSSTTSLNATLSDWTATNLDTAAALNATTILSGVGEGTSLYSTTLSLSSNNSNNFVFWVYTNNSGANYTAIGGPYRFIVDGGAPSITMTPPTDLIISPRGSITYTCKATESASGAYQMKWQLKKPSETVYTTKQEYASVDTNGEDSITFTGDDTNLAGEYNVKCLAIDNVGNEGEYISSSSETFSVHYTTSYGEGVAGEGAGAADIDLSTTEEITITEKQGVISTFTLDGTTVHTIKIKTVDEVAGTVTIVIESDPIEITLKTGETKEVDIDADGANDISVTLNKIIDGAADITTKRLTPLPTKEVPTKEVPPTEAPEEITPEVAPSKTWLWILIIVIIVVIGVGYWFMKRK